MKGSGDLITSVVSTNPALYANHKADALQVPNCHMFICNHLPVRQSVSTPNSPMLLKQSRDVPTTGPLQVPVIGIRQMRQAGVARKRYLGGLELLRRKRLASCCMRGASGPAAIMVQGTPVASEQA